MFFHNILCKLYNVYHEYIKSCGIFKRMEICSLLHQTCEAGVTLKKSIKPCAPSRAYCHSVTRRRSQNVNCSRVMHSLPQLHVD